MSVFNEKDGKYLTGRAIGARIAAGVVAVIALIAVVVVALGVNYSTTQLDEVTVVWNGGPLDNKSYRTYHAPGSGRAYDGFKSKAVSFTTAQRTYVVSTNPALADDPPDSNGQTQPITTTINGVVMRFELTAFFFLNHKLVTVGGTPEVKDGKPVLDDQGRQKMTGGVELPTSAVWWELQGRRNKASDFNDPEGKWRRNYLRTAFRNPLNDSFQRVAQGMAGQVDALPGAIYLNQTITFDPDGKGPLTPETGPAKDLLLRFVGIDLLATFRTLYGGAQGLDFFCGNQLLPGAQGECGPFRLTLDQQPSFADKALTDQYAAAQSKAVDADTAIKIAQTDAAKNQRTAEIARDAAAAVATANATRAATEAASAKALADAEVTKANEATRTANAQAETKAAEQRAAMADCIAIGATGPYANYCAALRGNGPTVVGATGVNVAP